MAISNPKPSKKQRVISADTRLAGRLRFYKEVGVVDVPTPFDDKTSSFLENNNNSVASPISAGVDGTDSASGVHRHDVSSNNNHWQSLLIPRRPGGDHDNNDSGKNTVEDLDWFGVTLDGRTVKTPMGKPLVVPSQHLAYGIAAEWDAQVKHLHPTNMPLMTLACTTLDQVAHHPHVYRKESLKFLTTDTTCFWADPTEDRVLHRRQEEAWKELHDHIEARLEHAPAKALGANEAMVMARKRANKMAGLPHPPPLLEKATDWVHSLDAWQLMAFSSMCSQAKSFFIAYCLLDPEYKVDMKRTMEASRVEEEFQISQWGLVEGGHDYDRLNCSIQLYSAQVFSKTIALDNDR